MKKVLGLALILAVLTPVTSVAKDNWYDGIYIGGSVGAGRVEADLEASGLQPPNGEAIESSDYAKTSLAPKIFFGYRFTRYFGVEFAYTRFYNSDRQFCFIDDTGECTEARGEPQPPADPFSVISSSAWTVDYPLDGGSMFFTGHLPFGNNDAFDLFLKVGGINWKVEAIAKEDVVGNFVPPKDPLVPSTNDPVSYKADGWDFAVGTGLNFNHPNGVTIRAEFEYYDIDELEQSMLLSLGLIYNF